MPRASSAPFLVLHQCNEREEGDYGTAGEHRQHLIDERLAVARGQHDEGVAFGERGVKCLHLLGMQGANAEAFPRDPAAVAQSRAAESRIRVGCAGAAPRRALLAGAARARLHRGRFGGRCLRVDLHTCVGFFHARGHCHAHFSLTMPAALARRVVLGLPSALPVSSRRQRMGQSRSVPIASCARPVEPANSKSLLEMLKVQAHTFESCGGPFFLWAGPPGPPRQQASALEGSGAIVRRKEIECRYQSCPMRHEPEREERIPREVSLNEEALGLSEDDFETGRRTAADH